MDLEQIMAARHAVLETAVTKVGSKAALGRRLGYLDGAFVGQMLRGKRPITEKTMASLLALPGMSRLTEASASTDAPSSAQQVSPPTPAQIVDALAGAAPERRAELAQVVALLLQSDSPLYRQRVAELLAPAPAQVAAPAPAPSPAAAQEAEPRLANTNPKPKPEPDARMTFNRPGTPKTTKHREEK